METKLVDLTQEIYVGMPVYPGMVRTQIFVWRPYDEMKRQTEGAIEMLHKGMLLSDHGPTHVDAPTQFYRRPEALSVDKLPLRLFYTSAVCLDVSHVQPPQNIGPVQ